MARISPTLRTLLESGAVIFCSTEAKKIESYKRREPLKWLLRSALKNIGRPRSSGDKALAIWRMALIAVRHYRIGD